MHQILTGREHGHNTFALITVFKMYKKRELLKISNVSKAPIKDYQQRQFTCATINEFYNKLKVIYMYMYLII
jgi:hypothetical protein